jgi:outer membrane protein, multidrug efflux system
MKRIVVAVLLVSLTNTFAFAQKKKKQPPHVDTPTVFRGDRTQPTQTSFGDEKWFQVFKDEKLVQLIRVALENNYDIQQAVARVEAAEANLGIVRSNQYPQFGASADLTTQRLSRSGAFDLPQPAKRDRTFGSILLNLLTFELDIWGRLRKATAAARAELLASDEARNAVLVTVVGDVATAYFVLRELDFELEISQQTLASRRESLRIIKLRESQGIATMLEVRQAEELVYDATEVIPFLEKEIEQGENFISYLIGRNPAEIPRGLSLTDYQMPPQIPAGLPSDLLERRPDIRSAEARLESADLQISVAKKAFFPRITLTGFLGFESGQLTSLFSGSRSVWALVPQLTQPIFTGGRLKSNVRFTQAQRHFFLVEYQKTIQNAFREVSDSLVEYQKSREVRVQRELLVSTLQDRSRLANLRYTGGVSTLLEVLDADRELFEAERSLAAARRDELLSVVQVYKALGGGWQI